MSRENVELVRRVYQDTAERGPAAALDFFHRDAEWHPPREDPDATPRRGREAISRYFGQWLDAWEDFRIEPESLLDAGDKVVAVIRITGRGRGSGVEFPELRSAHVFTLRESEIVRVQVFYDRDEALEAVGLRERGS
jgi:ketosteroid isomerase-like protein